MAGPNQIIKKISPALVKVIPLHERGKPRLVSIDILKEFRKDSGVHGFPSNPQHSAVLETDEMREIPNLMPPPSIM